MSGGLKPQQLSNGRSGSSQCPRHRKAEQARYSAITSQDVLVSVVQFDFCTWRTKTELQLSPLNIVLTSPSLLETKNANYSVLYQWDGPLGFTCFSPPTCHNQTDQSIRQMTLQSSYLNYKVPFSLASHAFRYIKKNLLETHRDICLGSTRLSLAFAKTGLRQCPLKM